MWACIQFSSSFLYVQNFQLMYFLWYNIYTSCSMSRRVFFTVDGDLGCICLLVKSGESECSAFHFTVLGIKITCSCTCYWSWLMIVSNVIICVDPVLNYCGAFLLRLLTYWWMDQIALQVNYSSSNRLSIWLMAMTYHLKLKRSSLLSISPKKLKKWLCLPQVGSGWYSWSWLFGQPCPGCAS